MIKMDEAKPYGGKLITKRFYNKNDIGFDVEITIDKTTSNNIEQIVTGSFSPLEGFMNKDNFESCINNMQLSNGLIWPIPIVASINASKMKEIETKKAEKVGLFYNKQLQAILDIEDVYEYDKEETAKKIFGTADSNHPGVRKWISQEKHFVGGKLNPVDSVISNFPTHNFSPIQTRKIFKEKGWKTVCGFQTRNIPHIGHEHMQRIALEICDGLFVQPLVGWKKTGDFKSEAIIRAYEVLIENYHLKNRVLLGVLSTTMFYAGPREAIFHAIIRKNFGCTHFIIGKDHAGVGKNGESYYKTFEASELLSKLECKIGIKVIKVDTIYHFNTKLDKVVESVDGLDKSEYRIVNGSTIRDLLKNGYPINSKLVKPEVIKVISKDDLIE